MHEENFLNCWLRDDPGGEAEEVEEVNRKAKDDEEATSGHREAEGEWERVEIDCKRVFVFRFLFQSSSESL